VKCPQCQKRFSPQGLNGHLRFVHGVGAAEASTAVSRAPRNDDLNLALARMNELEERVEALSAIVESQSSRSGMRHRLVELAAELSKVRKQKNDKEWDAFPVASAEEREMLAALDQVEQDLRQEITTLTARLRELGGGE